jgi:hypothetical protein
MLNLDDSRWTVMKGGYRVLYDPRRALRKLETGSEMVEAWDELWQELYHQGDVGEASYAAVPQLVRIYRKRDQIDWNTYAIVTTIELARDNNDNPAVPGWLENEYQSALTELAQIGLVELQRAENPDTLRCILAVLALWKGLRTYARFLLEYSEDELVEFQIPAS